MPEWTVFARRLAACIYICLALTLSACGIRPYHSSDVASAPFLERALTQVDPPIRVSVAVPDARETLALTGLDLYGQGIQPVWLQVENQGTQPARIAPWSIDPYYFSPIEVAYMNRRPFSASGYKAMERWFHDSAIARTVPPGEKRAGLVFTHLTPGTKGFNLDVFSDRSAYHFTFFVPLPGFTADYMLVDFAGLYEAREIRRLDSTALRSYLENELPCCATGPAASGDGGPLNAVLVGTASALRRSLLRGGWHETRSESGELDSARRHRYRGRPPDGIFYIDREDSQQRIQLHVWRAPFEVDGEPGWLGQVYYRHRQGEFLRLLGFDSDTSSGAIRGLLARESVVADIDSAQRFLVQSFWYNQSLRALGLVAGVGESTVENPRVTFEDIAYVTGGQRAVLFLSETPVSIEETRFLYLDPLSTGQGSQPATAHGDRLSAHNAVAPPNGRLSVARQGDLTVSAAVPSAVETESVFGADLYARNIQPVWVRVENRGDATLYLTPFGLDPAYYSPRESALRLRGKAGVTISSDTLEGRAITRLTVPPRSTQSGYIFTRVDEGSKSFNVDVLGPDSKHLMNFVVPVPGLKIDHREINIDDLYPKSALQPVDLPQLAAALERMPCCVRDAGGEDRGDPLNLVFIGEAHDLYYALKRAGWDETETLYGKSLWKTFTSAVTGGRYRYSPVSALYTFGRAQDAAFQRARTSIHERNHFRIWLTPLRFNGQPVWIGQISRDIGVHLSRRTITTHKIDPDVDETREYLLEDLAYAQSVRKFGYVGGVGAAPYTQPRSNLTGDPYFTDGRRLVMWISRGQNAISEIEILDLATYRSPID